MSGGGPARDGERPDARGAELIARDAAALAGAMKVRLQPLTVARASGTRIWDADGNEYLDWMGVAGAAATGYGHPRVRDAIVATLEREHSHTAVCAVHEPAVELAERLVALVPGDFARRAWLGLSGSDALDCLVKLTPIASGRPGLLAFVGGYHGLTIGSSRVSGHLVQTRAVPAENVTKVPYPYPYRCPWGPCDPAACSLKCLRYVEEVVFSTLTPPDRVAAVFVEAIQSVSGEIVPPANYLPALRELCDKHGIWLIFDEVKTGLGRTGDMLAYEHDGVVADAVALGKALGGGLPLSAVVGRSEILDVEVTTAHCLGGSPMPCSAAIATLDAIAEEDLAGNARALGDHLMDGLRALAADHRLIGDVRGRGLLIGVELVRDRRTREPAAREAAMLAYRCYELGLVLLYTGIYGNVIEITPPLTTTRAECDEALAIFERALTDVEAGRFDATKLGEVGGW